MAIRRPRIKATANLMSIKRKAKPTTVDPTEKNENPVSSENTKTNIEDTKTNIEDTKTNVEDTKIDNVKETSLIEDNIELKNEKSAFKEPPKYNINNPTDDVFHTSSSLLEENVIQIDMQKSFNVHSMSPKQQKRPRLNPSPVISQRRNSSVTSSPHNALCDDSSNDFIIPSPRRERYNSTSLISSSPHLLCSYSPVHSPHKYMPFMGMRQRTESTCSVYSDSYGSSIVTKTRKPPPDEQNTRAQWRLDYKSRCNNGIPDKSRLKMFDLIYYNPSTNPMEIKTKPETIVNTDSTTDSVIDKDKNTEVKKDEILNDNENKNVLPVPQLKLNANNELVLDDQSLEIETTAEVEARKMLANSSLVYVDENSGMNGFYKRHKRTREWLYDETIKFYRCLQTVGTDFSLIGQLFPTRTRREMKLKFKREERYNGNLINKALLYPKTFNVDELKQQLEEESEKIKKEKLQWQEIQMRKPTKSKKIKSCYSSADRILHNGIDIYKNENVPKENLSKRVRKVSPIRTNVPTENIKMETKQLLKNHVEKSLAKNILKTVKEQEEKLKKEHSLQEKNTTKDVINTKEKRKVTKTSKKRKISDSEDINFEKYVELEKNLTEILNNQEENEKETMTTYNENSYENKLNLQKNERRKNIMKTTECNLITSQLENKQGEEFIKYNDESISVIEVENIQEIEEYIKNGSESNLGIFEVEKILEEECSRSHSESNLRPVDIENTSGEECLKNNAEINSTPDEVENIQDLGIVEVGNTPEKECVRNNSESNLEMIEGENFRNELFLKNNIENNLRQDEIENLPEEECAKIKFENNFTPVEVENTPEEEPFKTNSESKFGMVETENIQEEGCLKSNSESNLTPAEVETENILEEEFLRSNSESNLTPVEVENVNEKENLKNNVMVELQKLQEEYIVKSSIYNLGIEEIENANEEKYIENAAEQNIRTVENENVQNNEKCVKKNYEKNIKINEINEEEEEKDNIQKEDMTKTQSIDDEQTNLNYTPENTEEEFLNCSEISDVSENAGENHNEYFENENTGEQDEYNARVEKLVQEIEEGGLMLVTYADKNNSDNIINEVYMVNKESGDIYGKPLNLPKDILDAIIELAE